MRQAGPLRKKKWNNNSSDNLITESLPCSSNYCDIRAIKNKNELSYRKQIARQLRTQYVDGIYDNPVTLKSRLTVTQGHWKRNHSVDHIRLTIRRVIGRWILSWPWNVGQRSLKVIEICAIRKLGCSFLFAFYSNYGRICSHLWDIQCQRMAWPENQVRGRSRSLNMAPFDKPYATFYWSAIVNIALSCTIFEFFDVEWYCDLEIGVRGHSMSLKLVPFENLGAVSHSPSIVTVAVSVAVCETFSVKEWHDLENQVMGRSEVIGNGTIW